MRSAIRNATGVGFFIPRISDDKELWEVANLLYEMAARDVPAYARRDQKAVDIAPFLDRAARVLDLFDAMRIANVKREQEYAEAHPLTHTVFDVHTDMTDAGTLKLFAESATDDRVTEIIPGGLDAWRSLLAVVQKTVDRLSAENTKRP